MGSANWMYDAMLYVYALSLLFYFSDFVDANRKAKRIGAGLLIFVWLLQTGYLFMQVLLHDEAIQFNPFEYSLVFSWFLVTVSLIINRFFYIDFIVFFVNVVGFAVLALNFYGNPRGSQRFELWQTTKEMLYVHISLVLAAYASLMIGALLAGMYMFLHKRLKNKKWTKAMHRFPSLDTIDRYMERSVIIGVPLLTMSLAIAVTSLLVEGRAMYLLDWKVLASFAGLLLYIRYIYLRAVNEMTGLQLSKLFLVAYGLLIVNVVTDSFSSFH